MKKKERTEVCEHFVTCVRVLLLSCAVLLIQVFSNCMMNNGYLCKSNAENLNHILWHCPFAKQMWNWVASKFKTRADFNSFNAAVNHGLSKYWSDRYTVHLCNKLASRRVRVGLADPVDVSLCDICNNAPAFFYSEVDGTSLWLECDMIVHVGGNGRYLLFRQRVEFPGDKPGHLEDLALQRMNPGEGSGWEATNSATLTDVKSEFPKSYARC
ncbi:hypothetical protein IFM89_034167 [Coptis chinensis]|uniref:Reverse transcriptase zinc-binding domain-containing protein n=1 Tax=Coptis chinensis TaxID=261450 RepID=A0A835LSF2_9MAGN|nr:hypothetical protein IFM89_034167 [Coptis chinensis]